MQTEISNEFNYLRNILWEHFTMSQSLNRKAVRVHYYTPELKLQLMHLCTQNSEREYWIIVIIIGGFCNHALPHKQCSMINKEQYQSENCTFNLAFSFIQSEGAESFDFNFACLDELVFHSGTPRPVQVLSDQAKEFVISLQQS